MAKDKPSKRAQNETQAENFNDQSGANIQKDGGDIILNKKSIMTLLKQRMPHMNGNTLKLADETINPTENQRNMIRNLEERPINLVDGPFGTGKTFWACFVGLNGLLKGDYNRISITAPAVEAGENLGFLKGGLEDKMLPYVNQILENIDDFVGEDLRKQMQTAGLIRIEPHAFLRGRTMKKTFFILDECQNASGPQLITALTRLGKDSTFVFMGDSEHQNDRTDDQPAFAKFVQRFTKPVYDAYVGFSPLAKADVSRHEFLKLMVDEGDHLPLPAHESHSPINRHNKRSNAHNNVQGTPTTPLPV